MKEGYLDDKWVQGGSNPDAYAIWHWYLMDVFVYFSHHLVTLPPPCWTNAAHTHGVRVLGTFITERDKGRDICRTLLSSNEFAWVYAERLAEIAVALDFDGWLLNMENNLDLEQIPILKEFISHLTQTMHASVPESLVIWCDAVTKEGLNLPQEMLNTENKPFFDLCDGIFIDYSWEARNLSLRFQKTNFSFFWIGSSVAQFCRIPLRSTQLKLPVIGSLMYTWALVFLAEAVHILGDGIWWGLVEKSWGILRNYPKALPFYSNFDQGHGYHFSIEGSKVADEPWNNISCQTTQPVLDNELNSIQTPIAAQRNFKGESYSGGPNVTFAGSLMATKSSRLGFFLWSCLWTYQSTFLIL